MTWPALYEGVDPAAQAAVRAYCGWHIAPSLSETLVLDGTGARAFILPTLHLTSIEMLKVNGQEVTLPVEFSRAGIVRYPTPDKLGAIEITFTHGYSSEDLVDLMAIMPGVSKLVKLQGGSVRIGQVQFSTGALNVGGLDAHSAGVLDRYARPFRAGVL